MSFAIQLQLAARCRATRAIGDGASGPFLRHMMRCPTITLSVIFIALIARMTRASVMEVLQEDYVRTARAKGQSEFKVCCAMRCATQPCRSSP